jgi:hypothetical protein
MRVLVCGGRDYADRARVFDCLGFFLAHGNLQVLIHGAAHGADTLARQWADFYRVPCLPFPADWARDGRAAGPIRNRRMLVQGRPDLVIAFPGGPGTRDMTTIAHRAGLTVWQETDEAP